MATTQKTKRRKTADASKMNPDKVEKIEMKKLIHDERSHKIAGTVLILISFLLFVAFTSYLLTWQQDQSKVLQGAKILLPSHEQVMANALGTAGAYFSDFFFRSGFGIASYLFCLFFFVVGVNLFAPKKIFSVRRNVRYVIAGLLVISVCASFLMHTPHLHNVNASNPEFFWGGKVGDMINEWLQQMIGYIGTAALLLVCLLSYIIWRFNPSFNFSRKKIISENVFSSLYNDDNPDENNEEDSPFSTAGILPLTQNPSKDEKQYDHEFGVFEKNEGAQKLIPKDEKVVPGKIATGNGLTLEVKNAEALEEKPKEIAPVTAQQKMQQDPYDPILDLRNYKYPQVDLLETYGSERIVQDASELEDNKNQIINTLRNYDIEIQKIFATVGPTVTLYEIIPAPGVRISRIKNLEDDIALSISALGIRII
ncbi:MAG: DNA translocase FtsK 4TM domain-containing protein, partial [Ginsengibacter sp.]